MESDTGAAVTTGKRSRPAARAGLAHRRRRQLLVGWGFLAPAFLLLLVFQFAPLVSAVYLSFTEYDGISSPAFVGFSNYVEALQDRHFVSSFKNTVIYLLVTPAIIVCSLAVSLLVNRSMRGVKLFRAAYYIPVVTPAVATALVWGFLFRSPNGLLNSLLTALPFVDEPVNFLTSTSLALPSVMSVELWKGLGYFMVIFLAGLQAIPTELHDAAVVDGASPLQETLRVTIPQLRPSITFVAIISGMAALKAFDLPFIMTGGGPAGASETVVMRVYNEAFSYLNIGYAAAESVLLFVAVMGLSYANLKWMERGGAVQND